MFCFWGAGFAIVVISNQPHQPLVLVYRRRMMANILQIVQTAAFIAWCSIRPLESLGHNHLQKKQEYLTSFHHE
jgi:hypothetical protein